MGSALQDYHTLHPNAFKRKVPPHLSVKFLGHRQHAVCGLFRFVYLHKYLLPGRHCFI